MKPVGRQTFSLEGLLTAGLPRTIVKCLGGAVVFSQGDPADSVMYVQKGRVMKSGISKGGEEAVVAVLGPGDFFGVEGLTGRSTRIRNAIAITPCTLLIIDKAIMRRLLHTKPGLADQFIAYLLARNVRIEEDLIDQRVNSGEQRLARALLQLARHGARGSPKKGLPTISQTTLAKIVGTTRSRINGLLKKFKRAGCIDTDGGLTVDRSRLTQLLVRAGRRGRGRPRERLASKRQA